MKSCFRSESAPLNDEQNLSNFAKILISEHLVLDKFLFSENNQQTRVGLVATNNV